MAGDNSDEFDADDDGDSGSRSGRQGKKGKKDQNSDRRRQDREWVDAQSRSLISAALGGSAETVMRRFARDLLERANRMNTDDRKKSDQLLSWLRQVLDGVNRSPARSAIVATIPALLAEGIFSGSGALQTLVREGLEGTLMGFIEGSGASGSSVGGGSMPERAHDFQGLLYLSGERARRNYDDLFWSLDEAGRMALVNRQNDMLPQPTTELISLKGLLETNPPETRPASEIRKQRQNMLEAWLVKRTQKKDDASSKGQLAVLIERIKKEIATLKAVLPSRAPAQSIDPAQSHGTPPRATAEQIEGERRRYRQRRWKNG